ncbi:unnamed protein product [Fusarium venenatum]|uniref:Uncharacterized protein n=1 Tax=Fusarium venenatum TaxID=56646 RepID=A0A2L2T187_9HYPO|nr:uncharacterized protein FVRRES_11520 [Fusarium venenatum]CEI38829.1 unnamed protein product [Fusarium venenatum]
MKTIQTLPVAMLLSGVIAGEFPSMPGMGMKGEEMSAPTKPPATTGGSMGGNSNNCPPAVPVTVTEPVYITVTDRLNHVVNTCIECPMAPEAPPPPAVPVPPPQATSPVPEAPAPPAPEGPQPPSPPGGESGPPSPAEESGLSPPKETGPSTSPEKPIVPPLSGPSQTPVGPPAIPVAAGTRETWSLGALVLAGVFALAL